jgi:hypothetical protein
MAEKDIREYIEYDKLTGAMTWIKSNSNRVKVGDKVSHIDAHGYIGVSFNGSRYKGHRLAWYLSTGMWPEGDIDHINGDRTDNRLENLRACSRGDNLKNMRVSGKGSSKYKGVCRMSNGRYSAQITVNNKKKHLGCFVCEDDAALAYNEAAVKLYKEFANLNRVEVA